MRGRQVLLRAERDNAGGIDVVVGDVVVTLDMIEIDRVGNPFSSIEVFEIAEEIGVVGNAADVALEVAMIDGVKPDERDEEAPIRFDELRAEQIPAIREPLLDSIERLKEPPHRLFIGS